MNMLLVFVDSFPYIHLDTRDRGMTTLIYRCSDTGSCKPDSVWKALPPVTGFTELLHYDCDVDIVQKICD